MNAKQVLSKCHFLVATSAHKTRSLHRDVKFMYICMAYLLVGRMKQLIIHIHLITTLVHSCTAPAASNKHQFSDGIS